VKYTIGASPDYNQIAQLRKSLLAKFPEAFVIAFRNGEKMNVQEAVRIFRNRKK
jgi:N-acetylmuramoyl-L-alanine amidase